MGNHYGTDKNVREILFTFDDGPNPSTTPKLLDILAKHNIKAMFFVVGQRLNNATGRSIMVRAYNDGHFICNHTYSHKDLKTLSSSKIREELRRTRDLIGEYAHDYNFFRPPYGSINARVSSVLQEEGYMNILWSVDTMDWKYKRNGSWVDYGMDQIKARQDSLVLMHDIHKSTVDNVERLINRIKRIPNSKFVNYV